MFAAHFYILRLIVDGWKWNKSNIFFLRWNTVCLVQIRGPPWRSLMITIELKDVPAWCFLFIMQLIQAKLFSEASLCSPYLHRIIRSETKNITLCNFLCLPSWCLPTHCLTFLTYSQIRKKVFKCVNVVLFCVFQLGVWCEDSLKGSGKKTLQALPIYHPCKENVQGAAAAQTHEAWECKWPWGLGSVCAFSFLSS